MPIIKSAKKRVKQAEKAYQKNKHYNSRMRTLVKNVLKTTEADKAEKILPEAYSAIDTALKKKILHRNNAAHKKSLIARKVASLKENKTEVKSETTEKKTEKKVVAQPKAQIAKKPVKKATKGTKKTVTKK